MNLTTIDQICKNKFRSHTKESVLTTPARMSVDTIPNNPKRILKLHSRDIAYLKVIRFYQTKAKNRKCYLSPSQWGAELVKFGGKSLSDHHRKKKRQKLEKLGYVISSYESGNRNREKIVYLTNDGLNALETYSQIQKNNPAKLKKQPGEIEKTTRPLSSGSVNESNDHEFAMRKEENKPNALQSILLSLGLFPGLAKKVLSTASESHIRVAFQRTQNRRPEKPGAYFMGVLGNLAKEQNKDHRCYGLEEKSRLEKKRDDLMYGFPVKTLNEKARPGETYFDVANRLRRITN